MNRWLQRLAELDGDGALARAQDSVQFVQYVQNSRLSHPRNLANLHILSKLHNHRVRLRRRRRRQRQRRPTTIASALRRSVL
jgi:hypothetical protein